MIAVLLLLAVAIAALFWHELAHFLVADRYKAVNRISIIRHKGRYLRWLIFGAAVNVDSDQLTDRQLWNTMLAPLVWIGPGIALLVAAYIMDVPVLVPQSIVWVAAALLVFLSDIPQYFIFGLNDENYQQYTLIDFRGRYE